MHSLIFIVLSANFPMMCTRLLYKRGFYLFIYIDRVPADMYPHHICCQCNMHVSVSIKSKCTSLLAALCSYK